MAIYAKAVAGKNILNGCAVGRAPQPHDTTGVAFQSGNAEVRADMDDLQAKLNGRYKVGGPTGWERPGSNLP